MSIILVMKDKENLKRLNILVPKELYEEFIKFADLEYKSTTALVIEWMQKYIQENEASERQVLLNKFVKVKLFTAFEKALIIKNKNLSKELSAEASNLFNNLIDNPKEIATKEFTDKVDAIYAKVMAQPLNES